MARARSNQPTIAERLNRPSLPDARVRAYGYTEYEGRRPGYVSYNSNAGKAWGDLARALDGFNSSMTKAYTKHKEVEIEQGIAQGKVVRDLAKETLGQESNKKKFKELIEEHPELANYDPWVEVGYNQACLRELSMELDSGLTRHLAETGAYNLEDPKAFESRVNEYVKGFREQAGINSYNDKLLVAHWFSPNEAKAREKAVNQYNTLRINGRQDRLATQLSSNIATILRTAAEEDRPVDPQALSFEKDEADKNGLLRVKQLPAVLNGIKVYIEQTGDRDGLELIKNIVVDGIRLIDTPEGAKYYNTKLDEFIAADVKADKDDAKATKKYYEETVKILAFEMSNKIDEVGSFDAMRPAVEEKIGRQLTEIEWFDLTVEAAKKVREQRQVDKTELNTPINKSGVKFEINDIITTSETPMKELRDRYLTTNIPDFWEAYERLEKEGITEARTNAKELKTYVGNVSKAAVESLIRQDSSGVIDWNTYSKSKYYMAMSDVKKRAFNYLSLLIQEEEEKLAPEGTELTPQKRERALLNAQQRFEENFVGNGVLTKGYPAESFLIDDINASSPFTQAMIQTATPEEAVQVESWSQAYSPILNSSTEISDKVKRDINFLCDLPRMAKDNVMDASLRTLLKYMRPETQMVGCTLSPDGKTINVPRDPNLSPEDAQERLIRIQNVFTGYEVRFIGQ